MPAQRTASTEVWLSVIAASDQLKRSRWEVMTLAAVQQLVARPVANGRIEISQASVTAYLKAEAKTKRKKKVA